MFVSIALLLLADPADDARVALALALAARPAVASTHSDAIDYGLLYRRSLAEGRPLIVWVGVPRPAAEQNLPGCLHHHCDSFPGATAPCAVVAKPGAGTLLRLADLPAAIATRERIADLVRDPPPPTRCGPNGCRRE